MRDKQHIFIILSFLFISLIAYASANSDNEIFIGGNFLEVFMDNEGNVKHAASLIGYDIDSTDLDDDFDAVLLDYNALKNLVGTPVGIYASGPFNYVDYDYSNTITEYDPDDDEWTSLQDGIWCHNCVQYITSASGMVFFAGQDITTVEALPNVTLSGVVMMDPDTEDFFPLSDPNGVFPTNPNIEGVAGGDYLYIYEAGTDTIYKYDVENSVYTVFSSNFAQIIINSTLTSASNGDLYAFAYSFDAYTATYTQFLYFWPANSTAGAQPTSLLIKQGSLSCTPPSMTPYLTGVLLSIPDPLATVRCSSSFSYVNSGVQTDVNVPYSPYPVSYFSGGNDDEVWVVVDNVDDNNNNLLYYWNSTLEDSTWHLVPFNLIDIDLYSVSLITYSTPKTSLYVYIIDNSGSTSTYELVRIKSDDFASPILKNPGSLAIPGYVYGLAYDSSHDVLYVGGQFTACGGTSTENLAYYSFGDDEWQGFKGADRIQGLTIIDTTVYMIYSECGSIGGEIPFDAYSIDDGDVDVKSNLPIFYKDNGCLYSVSSNSTHVYIGGYFTAQIDGVVYAYGLLIYNPEDDAWSTLPIDDSITSTRFEILSIAEFSFGDDTYIAFGGFFDFTTTLDGDTVTFINFALWSISNQTWVYVPVPDLPTIKSVVYMYNGVLILGGPSRSGDSFSSVVSYDITTQTFTLVPGLHSVVNSILLYTIDDKDGNPNSTAIYAGGFSPTGVAVANYTDPTWTNVGDVYNNMFDGYVNVLMYSTGGNGAGGVNGGSSASSDWWWITLIVIGSLLIFVSVLAILSITAYLVWKKRDQLKYNALN